MFSKILVPVDGSEGATKALNAALEEAATHKAELNILYVVPEQYASCLKDSAVVVRGDLIKAYKETLHKLLEEPKAKAEAVGIKVNTFAKPGEPADVIVATAKKQNCDVIVIGSRGLSGLKATFLGSVSSAVIKAAEIPVLVVK